jgi:hypothetical protein
MLITPRAKPLCSFGVCAATKALLAAITPVVAPCSARRITSCSAFWTKPIAPTMMAPPSVARSNISLRPLRSATVPQIGEAIIMVKACAEKAIPAQNSRLPVVLTPRSRT